MKSLLQLCCKFILRICLPTERSVKESLYVSLQKQPDGTWEMLVPTAIQHQLGISLFWQTLTFKMNADREY